MAASARARAVKSGPTGRRDFRADAGQLVGNVAAERCRARDDDDADQSRDQGLFDRRGAALVFAELRHELLHGRLLYSRFERGEIADA